MFAVTGFLPKFSTSLVAFKWKNCGKSDLCSPVTPSSSRAASTTVSATTQIVFTALQLLRRGWKLGLQSSHLSGRFKNISSQSYECWMTGTYRTQRMVRTKPWCLFMLTDLVTQWPWSALMKYFEAFMAIHSTAIQGHFASISLNTKNHFSTQCWSYLLPAEVVIFPVKTLWAHYTPGKMGNNRKKKHLPKDKVSSATALLEKQVIRVCVSAYVRICLMKRYL